MKRPLPSRRVGRSAALFVLILLLAVSVLSAMSLLTTALSPVSSDKDAPAVLVNIPSGASANEIGRLLARRHLIRSAFGFAYTARAAGLTDKMKAGRYELSPAMPPRQMAALIALGQTAQDVVTLPEGFTVAQIARRLADKKMAAAPKFLALAKTQGRTFEADGFRPLKDNLEGYLFPDTYQIPRGASERAIITQMLRGFQRRVLQPHRAEIAAYPGGLPALVTLASLIEREARVPADRPRVAAALSNRLQMGMRLECDATIEYALPAHKNRLLYADLRVDSPYNTYLHAGLPPTPIANPGLSSIEAALHPEKADYLFYVARPDGSHIFSRTLAEHNRAVAQVRAARRGT